MADRPPRRQARKAAVALQYEGGARGAPRVIAKGKGLIAEKILAEAASHGIPLHEDADLAEALGGVDIGSEIPSELYAAVAEILIFVKKAEKE